MRNKALGISTYNYLWKTASGRADSPQLSRLCSVAILVRIVAFSVICRYARDFMLEVSCPRSARPSGKMCCCCQISTAENYIVFDAKLTQWKKTIFIRILVLPTVKVLLWFYCCLQRYLAILLKILLLWFIFWYFAWSIIVIWLGVLTHIHWE